MNNYWTTASENNFIKIYDNCVLHSNLHDFASKNNAYWEKSFFRSEIFVRFIILVLVIAVDLPLNCNPSNIVVKISIGVVSAIEGCIVYYKINANHKDNAYKNKNKSIRYNELAERIKATLIVPREKRYNVEIFAADITNNFSSIKRNEPDLEHDTKEKFFKKNPDFKIEQFEIPSFESKRSKVEDYSFYSESTIDDIVNDKLENVINEFKETDQMKYELNRFMDDEDV